MKTAIMQPYFFPYIGYWQLIVNADEFVFFDVVQYNKRSWMNRNRILHPDINKEFQYISLPINRYKKGTLIRDVTINFETDWIAAILGKLTYYKKIRAPYFESVSNVIEQIFVSVSSGFVDLVLCSFLKIFEYLEIDFRYSFASEIDFGREQISESGDWALAIADAIGADTYINPQGGIDLFDEEKFNKKNIALRFLRPNLTEYKQSNRRRFISGLSIIDILMFNSPQDVKFMLYNDFKLFSKKELVEALSD